MVPRMVFLPILFGLASSARGAVHSLQSRAIQTAAICSPDFAWMDNQQQMSPCLLNANLNAVCNGGSWTNPALNSSVHYDNPATANGTSTPCTCSWVSYNTISACAACQGFGTTIAVWGVYIQQCSGQTSSSDYYPPDLRAALPQSVTIPTWAVMNPTNWPQQRFDVATAKTEQSQGKADIVPNSGNSQKKKAPVGPIVGGVIGGLVVVAAVILLVLYMLRRKKRTEPVGPNVSTLGHLRSTSDVSSKGGFMTTTGYATLTSSNTPMYTNAPSSPTILTHGASSIRSMPFNSVIASSIPPTSSPPPLPATSPPPGPVSREDIIVPFTVRPSTPDRDRKHPNGPGAAYPIYDSPTAPPNQQSNIMRVDAAGPSTPAQRGRFNPPAYTESSPGATTPSSSNGNGRRPHAKKGSADTHDSTSTGIPAVRYPGGHVPAPHPASSAIVTDLTRGDTITSTSTGYSRAEGGSVPLGHGRTVGGSRDEKRDPALGGGSAPPPSGANGNVRDSATISARDIA